MTAIASFIERLESFANQFSSSKESNNQFAQSAQQVAEELIALRAIYGEESVRLLTIERGQNNAIKTVSEDEGEEEIMSGGKIEWNPNQPIRLTLIIPMDLAYSHDLSNESTSIRLSATLPSGYPLVESPPQFQLLSRYIGPFGVDHNLFGQILRIFIQTTVQNAESEHVKFERGQVALFDGIEKAKELIELWIKCRQADRSKLNQNEKQDHRQQHSKEIDENDYSEQIQQLSVDNPSKTDQHKFNHTKINLLTSPAISDRKSTFIGHAAALYDPSDVPIILENLLQDRRIARASHPAIHAWICKVKDNNVNGKDVEVIHRDCDDDGETAAGGRLAHLLDLCHVENAIVIVTRWYGGIHLGADRFKLINRAARDALELAQLVDGPLNPSRSITSKGRKDH